MTIAPNSGVTLTTPDKYGLQKNYNSIIYSNPATINAGVVNTNFGAGVVGTSYGTAAIPQWTLVNLSTIIGGGGVLLGNGGLVDNHVDTSLIDGALSYGVAIQGNVGTVTNQGVINAGASGGRGVYLAVGGAIANGATDNAYAYIAGQSRGIYARGGPGTITNFGSIAGQTGLYLGDGGTVENIRTQFGTHASVAAIRGDTVAGIIIAHNAGTVTNSGVISGATGIEGIGTATVTVDNSGRIYGGNRAGIDIGAAISLSGGGLVVNRYLLTTISTGTVGVYTTIAQPGKIIGGAQAIEATGQAATVVNYGNLIAYYVIGTGVELSSGGIVDNKHGGTISGEGGVLIQGGAGTLVNHYGALIEGSGTYSNSFAVQASGDVNNFGSITGGAGVSDGVAIVGTTTILPMVQNDGTIIGRYAAVAINGLGGTVRPQAELYNYNMVSPGLIQGGDYGVAMSNVTGTVFNGATIRALGGVYPTGIATGLSFYFSDGTIDNGAATIGTAYIFGKIDGVYVHNGAATITNFGTIKGGTGISTYGGTHSNTVINFGTIVGTNSRAVFFGKGNSRLVDEPGAMFVGGVYGGAGTNVLEFASGTSTGTLTGLGTTIGNFSTILVDAGANWYVDGSDFVALTSSGGTVSNSGTLNVRPGGVFFNDGSMDNIFGTFTVGTAASFANLGSVHGGVTLDASATLANRGGSIANEADVVLAIGTGAVVRNAATLFGYGTAGSGVLLLEGGTVVNGSRFAASPQIDGIRYGVSAAATSITVDGTVSVPSATVTNYATIIAVDGVKLTAPHSVIANGPSGVTAAVIYGSNDGVSILGGTVTNDGVIAGGPAGNTGIFLDQYGVIRNGEPAVASALITGAANGVIVNGSRRSHIFYPDAISISNFATIVTGGMDALHIGYGYGTIINGATNATAALISGNQDGIFDFETTLTSPYSNLEITNFGTIAGTIGVDSQAATVLTNFGTIIGSGGTAVHFGNNPALFVDEPNSVFVGKIVAGTGQNTLELAAGVTSGVLPEFGKYIANFGSVHVDTGASWEFLGNSTVAPGSSFINDGMAAVLNGDNLDIAAGIEADTGQHGTLSVGNATVALLGSVDASQLVSFSGATGLLEIGDTTAFLSHIDGFQHGNTIDLVNLVANQAVWSSSVLTISSGGIAVAELTLAGDYTGAHFFIGPDGGGGSAITTDFIACLAAGTRIGTRRGDVAVEDLAIGDMVWARFGGWSEIQWIGHRLIDCRRHPKPHRVWPVRIAADAFGQGQPSRPVWLSPDHAVFVDDVLIPIRYLLNGTSIIQTPREEVAYYHLELPRHDVLLAENLPAESYLDTGDRATFDNAGALVPLHPDFAIRTWEAAGCAPLIVSGPKLIAVRHRVDALAEGAPRHNGGITGGNGPLGISVEADARAQDVVARSIEGTGRGRVRARLRRAAGA